MAVTYVSYWGSHLKGPPGPYVGILRQLVDAGWKTYRVCSKPSADPKWDAAYTNAGVRIIYLPRPRGNFDWACVWRAYRMFKRLGCDVMHCHNMHASPLIGAALASVPVRLWSKHSMNVASEEMREPTFRDRIAISIRTSCRLATRVLPVSAAVKDELVGLGMPASKLQVFPNPIELEPLNGTTRRSVRTEYGYGQDEIVFTTVGHAVPVKGWDILIKSFAEVVDRCPKARLVFVGSIADDHERAHYKALDQSIRQLRLADHVQFLGRQTDIRRPLAAADVFVLPSRSEGYGNVLIEALTCGLPCVATRVGCATDVLREGDNGLLVARGDGKALSDAMIALASKPDLRSHMAKRVKAQRRYAPTFDEYSDRLLEVYRELLEVRVS